jgi:hypothetical protein
VIIHPYVRGSKSVKALKDYLEGVGHHTVVLHRRPMRPRARVVSWGARDIEYNLDGLRVLNHPRHTAVFCNKLRFFEQCRESLLVPPWTTGIGEATNWLNDGHTIVERHKLSGKSGEGIRIVEPGGELQRAPLYVKYEKKTDEFRVHVFKNLAGEFYVAHVQKKVAAPDRVQAGDIRNWHVRNHENGFIFQQHGFDCPALVSDTALSLVRTSFPEIDFVALDVIYHNGTAKKAADRTEPRAFVLEGNTAPGMEGTTVQVYGDFLLERFR